jgi:hypothetical protein
VKSGSREIRLVCLLLAAAVALSCATTGSQPTLTLEQHTLRIPLKVGANGSVSLAEQPPLTGRMNITPILEAEGFDASSTTVTTVQAMMFYGRFYVVADGFHSLWEITPRPGTSTASYRRIPITPDATESVLKGSRLSRYGSSQSSCLRLDRKNATPLFINSRGEASHVCP